MKINELARKTGLPAKTIRFYEDSGLIPAAARDASGYRHYEQADIPRFQFIRRCRDLRIPLDSIRRLIAVQTEPTASCGEVNQLLEEQHSRVQETIEELQALEHQLSELMVACHGTQVQHCGILGALQNGSNDQSI